MKADLTGRVAQAFRLRSLDRNTGRIDGKRRASFSIKLTGARTFRARSRLSACGPSIGVVPFPGFQVMNLAPLTAFELANLEFGRDFYDMTFLSEGADRPWQSKRARSTSRKYVKKTIVV